MCDKHGHDSCCQHSGNSGVQQTLDELDFERGLWGAAQSGDIDRIRKLLADGVPVDKVDAAGYTALHYAVRCGNEEIVSELLRAGADINARTRAGQATPAHRAATAGHSHIINLLIYKNADLNVVDSDGKTILHRAAEAQKMNICEKIIEKNPNLLNIVDTRGKYAIDYVKSENHQQFYKLIERYK